MLVVGEHAASPGTHAHPAFSGVYKTPLHGWRHPPPCRSDTSSFTQDVPGPLKLQLRASFLLSLAATGASARIIRQVIPLRTLGGRLATMGEHRVRNGGGGVRIPCRPPKLSVSSLLIFSSEFPPPRGSRKTLCALSACIMRGWKAYKFPPSTHSRAPRTGSLATNPAQLDILARAGFSFALSA